MDPYEDEYRVDWTALRPRDETAPGSEAAPAVDLGIETKLKSAQTCSKIEVQHNLEWVLFGEDCHGQVVVRIGHSDNFCMI